MSCSKGMKGVVPSGKSTTRFPGVHSYPTQSVSKSFCKSQLPHKYVNVSFTLTNIKNKLTDLCGN